MNMPVQPNPPRPAQPGQAAAAPGPAMAAPAQPQASQPGGGAPAQGGAARNPVRDLLLKRLDTLSQQEGDALMDGVSPEAAQALKKILPEVGDVIDEMLTAGAMMGQNRGGGQPPMPGGGQPQPTAAPAPAGPQPTPMARSRLAGV